MQVIKMYDTVLRGFVDLYQIGLPDPFGANALIYVDGNKYTYKNPDVGQQRYWSTINITRLDPDTTRYN